MRGFIKELRHRNVIRVSVAYVVTGWLIVQVADIAADAGKKAPARSPFTLLSRGTETPCPLRRWPPGKPREVPRQLRPTADC